MFSPANELLAVLLFEMDLSAILDTPVYTRPGAYRVCSPPQISDECLSLYKYDRLGRKLSESDKIDAGKEQFNHWHVD